MVAADHRRPDLHRKVLAHLRVRVADGDRYFKSRRLAASEPFSEYETQTIGKALASLERSGAHGYVFERFSGGPCVTWHVERVDDDAGDEGDEGDESDER